MEFNLDGNLWNQLRVIEFFWNQLIHCSIYPNYRKTGS